MRKMINFDFTLLINTTDKATVKFTQLILCRSQHYIPRNTTETLSSWRDESYGQTDTTAALFFHFTHLVLKNG